MSAYTLKLFKGRSLVVEEKFDTKDFDDGDDELTPTVASQIARLAASSIHEAVECNEAGQ